MNILDKKIKILVVDDHHVLRHGLISLLKENDSLEIVGEAGDGKETLKFLDDYAVDVVLLDVEMPVMNGNETLKNIIEKHPHIKVIMFTMYHALEYEAHFLKLGAKAYLAKNTDYEIISETITQVFNGEFVCKVKDIVEAKISDKHLQLALTDIEREVLIMICQNKSGSEIMQALNLKEGTLKYYRKSIYSKTYTNSLPELTIYALKQSLIPFE